MVNCFKTKSLLLADASPLQARGTYYLCVHSFNEYLLSTSTVSSAAFHQKTRFGTSGTHLATTSPGNVPENLSALQEAIVGL